MTAPEDPHACAGAPRPDDPEPHHREPDDPEPDDPEPDDPEPEERDPGLARERTSLAWTRTAIGFAALGGAVLKVNVVTGLIIVAIAPVVWQLGRISPSGSPGTDVPAVGTTRIRLITLSIVLVSLLSLLVALLGRSSPGALR
jgi:uncharacterized membrane protein YidH (DUF202 family)